MKYLIILEREHSILYAESKRKYTDRREDAKLYQNNKVAKKISEYIEEMYERYEHEDKLKRVYIISESLETAMKTIHEI